MTSFYIMCGLAFSGKSTLARKIAERTGSRLIVFDQLWAEKEKEQLLVEGVEGWRFIRKVAQDEIANTLRQGKSVVYDDTNVRFEHREEMRHIANKFRVHSIVIYLNTPMTLIKGRELANKTTGERHEVKPEDFQAAVDQMEAPALNEKVLTFTPNMDVEKFLNKLSV